MPVLPGIQFGSGIIFATPVAGDLAVDPTPQEVGIIQDVSLTLSGDIKELYGQFQWPVDSAIGKRSIKGTFNFAQMTNSFFNQLFFADTVAAGVIQTAYREAHSIPATTTYTVTVANAADFVADQGVINQNTGLAMVDIGSGSPTEGQYTFVQATGIYTFSSADASVPITISYTYSNTTLGTTLTVGNHVMGWGPVVSLTIPLMYQGTVNSINLPNVRLGKIDFKTKLDDYLMLSTDFSAFAGAGNNPLNLYNVA